MPPRRKTGRQALTEEKIKNVVFALKRGASRNDAAAFGGISHVTFYAWLKRGDEDVEAGRDSTPHANFANAVHAAEAMIAVDMTEAWTRAAAKGDYRAARDWLARRRPDDWAPIVDAPTIAVTVNAQDLVADPELIAKARALRDAIAARKPDAE